MPRAVSTALGVLLLTAVTLVLAGAVGVLAIDVSPVTEPVLPHQLSASADSSTGRIFMTHESGPPIDVRGIEVKILVDGTPLKHQPPVPFRGAEGFWGAPSGPFNEVADPNWEVGEQVGFRLATSSNHPSITPDSHIRIELYRDGLRIAVTETWAS